MEPPNGGEFGETLMKIGTKIEDAILEALTPQSFDTQRFETGACCFYFFK